MMIGRILLQRYQVIEQIGCGAFGDTYIAVDLAFPGQPRLVVKHLCPNNSEPPNLEIAKRLFKREAKVLSILGKHDQIPSLFSYFEEKGEFFLVQEWIEGHNLTQEFQPGKRWSEAETVKFLQELLEILSVVHQQDTIHRDLKPANIMRRQRDGKLVLIDFGAVKEILTINQEGITISSSTVGIGTYFYMPPEQATGRPGKYSDIYAVGMLGIQALTGLPSRELPQDSEHLNQMWNDLNIEINPQLKDVLERMVSWQYKQRFPDAAEALKALRATEPLRATETLIIPEIEPPLSSPEPPKRKLLFISLGFVGLIGAGIAGLTFLNQPNYAQLETYLQNKQWQQADAETDKIILKIAGENSALDAQSIDNFPCKSLRKIEKLWTENSNGRFGFGPQKQVYLETGNQIDQYTESTYQEFGNKVGWRTFGHWSLYGDLKFTNIAPVGHLPSPGKVANNERDLRIRERQMFLSRVDECGL